jgi:hypothetical protein
MKYRTNFALPCIFAICMAAALRTASGDEPASGAKPRTEADYLRDEYRAEAEKHAFFLDDEKRQPLKLVDHPIMSWSNDGQWSGDVFLWTSAGRPAIIGCMLSGPGAKDLRYVFDEFHLVADKPIAPAELQTRRRWAPERGLAVEPLTGAPAPAATAPARLTQMRKISRNFTAHMQANVASELRLLPQPLFRYGTGDGRKAASTGDGPEVAPTDDEGDVLDGALFTYVWTLGTDPELILLLECRRTAEGFAWHYAPVRFSNRALWLKHDGREVWRVEGHAEPQTAATSLLYTTAFSRSIPVREPTAKVEKPDSK